MNQQYYNPFSQRSAKKSFIDFFKSKSILSRLILINLMVFLVIAFVSVVFFLIKKEHINPLVEWLSVPADVNALQQKPWTIITYMFSHEELLHFLINMLWLYWFGKIFVKYIDTKKLVSVYFLGGIAGAVLFMLSYNFFPVFAEALPAAKAIGASASIMAVVFAISFYTPNYEINLLFIGKIKIKHIALFVVIMDILMIRGDNSGGHIAHIGGAMYGLVYALSLKGGKEIASGLNNFLNNLFFRRKKTYNGKHTRKKDDYEYNRDKKDNQERINEILDKISSSGYNSLTKEEKEILFKSGKN